MSDIIRTIVPKVTELPDVSSKIKSTIKWLQEIDAINTELSECTLGQAFGYNISNGAKKLVKEPELLPYGLTSNGLGIAEGRRIFTNMEGGLESIICPSCKINIVNEEWDFFDTWYRGDDYVKCSVCNNLSNMLRFKLEPKWGFSNVGFQFNNWPEFKSAFITEFEQQIDCRVYVIYSHI